MKGEARGLVPAFAWLRWRILLNGLRRRRRGRWQRLGAWADLVGKIVLWGMAGSGALGLGVAALFVPWALQPERSTEAQAAVLLVLRGGLAVFTLTILVIPAFQGFSGGSFARTRLLLLPVRHRLLHALETAAHLADPWLLMAVPALLAAGVAAVVVAGAGGLVVLAAGVVFALLLAVLSSIAGFGIELLLRNRRRAETAAVVLMVVWITAVMVPGLLDSRREAQRRADLGTEEGAGEVAGEAEPPAATREAGEGEAADEGEEDRPALAVLSTFPAALQVVPSEAYARAVFLAVRGRPAAALVPLALLALLAVALHALSHAVWRRLQAEPAVAGGRRGTGALPRPPRVPGLSPAAAAVAWAQLRGLLRTLVGRLGLFLVPVVTLFLTFTLRARLPGGFGGEEGLRGAIPGAGALLVVGATVFALLSVQTFTVNQFAVDGAGFSLARLAPVERRDLVLGKAVAGGLLAGAFALLGTGVVLPLEPDALPFWPAALLAGASAYLLLAPFYAWVSMVLPKAVDLGRLGKASQPNQVAGLLGVLAIPFAFLPAIVLGGTVFATTRSAAAVTLALALWVAATAVAARLLLRVAADALAAREESIYLALLEGT
ncbi:MAG TPA: hypothetical protein VF150_05565 [Thermoanaerobaculia bacterium]